MGHRLLFSVDRENLPAIYKTNEHNILFLFLYDVWVDLYGEEFAHAQVDVEKLRSNPNNDYKAFWEKALSFTKEERRRELNVLLSKKF